MYTVYVIRSFKNNKRYVGYTSKNVQMRLSEHNRGCNKWSRENRPLKLIYQENFNTKIEAIKREKFLKSGRGKKYLNTKLK